MPMEQLMTEKLQALYGAEQQFTQALQQLAQQAQSPELKQVLQQHLQESEGQAKRLEQIFQQMGQQATPQVKQSVQALIKDSMEMIQKAEPGPERDHAITGAEQIAEHFEIAAYGTIRAMAEAMGQSQVAQLLQQSLDEEKNADQMLTQVGEKLLSQQLQAA